MKNRNTYIALKEYIRSVIAQYEIQEVSIDIEYEKEKYGR